MQKYNTAAIIRRVLFTLMLVANIIFIFYNSSQIGEVSGGISLVVMEWMNSIFQSLGLSFRLTNYMVRKLGHFSEYMLLGFWFMMCLRAYTRRIIAFIAWPLLGGLLVAVADEFYQGFVPGRTSAVTDVVIDFSGVACGVLAALLFTLLITAIFRKVKPQKSRPG